MMNFPKGFWLLTLLVFLPGTAICYAEADAIILQKVAVAEAREQAQLLSQPDLLDERQSRVLSFL